MCCETKISPGGHFELGALSSGPKYQIWVSSSVRSMSWLDKVPRSMHEKLEQGVRSWKIMEEIVKRPSRKASLHCTTEIKCGVSRAVRNF